jgi:DHA1 family tetracycline resistance protein-like MFS transporter
MKKRSPIFSIIFTVFIDMLGVGVLIPVIPMLFLVPESTEYLLPIGTSLNSGFVLFGLLLCIFPLMQFISAPILGQLSDRFGRKPILVIALLGTCLGYILFAVGVFTKNIPLIFASRALDGITGGNISVAQAAIADSTEPKDRAKTFGLIGAAFGLGFIIGPFVGGILSDSHVVFWFNSAIPFIFTSVLAFINVLLVIFRFTETNKHKAVDLKLNIFDSIRRVIVAFRDKKLSPLFFTNFLYVSGFTFFTGFFGAFLIKKFGFGQSEIGNYFAYIGIWIVITQAFITRYVSKRLEEKDVLKWSMLGTGIFMVLQVFVPVWYLLLIISPFFAIFNGLSNSNSVGLISKSADKSMQGQVLGMNSSVQALANIFPPLLAGFIAANLSYYSPILIGGFIVIFAGLFFRFVAYRRLHTSFAV